jgi:putative aldouronate transport system permease protein
MSIWKETGWSAIIYLASMTGINSELYESSYMDGAGRWKRIWHITLPGIRPTIIILLILSSGWILGAGFEQSLLFGNGANFDSSEVIGSYIYRYGLKMNRISFATAASVFQSMTGFILVIASNHFSNKLSETKLF